MDKQFLTESAANSYSPLSLAFLGDSVYDTYVRDYLLKKANMPVAKLHSAKIKLVCAEFQSEIYEIFCVLLTDHELSVMKRGRNATGNTVPRHADAAQYRRATAVECLFGYLYITGQRKRLDELFESVIDVIENEQIGV